MSKVITLTQSIWHQKSLLLQ